MGTSGPSFSHHFPLSPLYFFPHHFPFPLCLFPSLEISLYFSLCPLLLLSSPSETVDIRQLQHHSSQLARPAPSGLQWLTLTGDKQRWERLASHCANLYASLIAQLVKNPPVMQETWVQFLGWEDSPREGHGNPLHYSCLENPHRQRSLEGYNPWSLKESDATKHSTQYKPWSSGLSLIRDL